MDKYLLQILHEVNTIIIPGLGALTVTNKTSGEIMFMSFLKHDDGNLAKHISEKENISENDAKNLIAKYVREVQGKLDTGDTYDMYQFGRFIKKDGEIDFESWNNYQHPANEEENTGEPEELTASVVENPITEEQTETQDSAAQQDENSKTEEATEPEPLTGASNLDDILNKEQEEVKPEGEPLDAVPEPKDPPVEQIRVEEVKLDVSQIEPTENVYIPQEEVKEIAAKQAQEKKPDEVKKVSQKASQPIVTVAPTEKKKKEKEKKSTLFWVMVIVIVLVLAGGGATAVFYKDIFGNHSAKLEEKTAAEKSDENLEEIEKQVELEAANEASENEPKAEEVSETAKEEAVKEEPVVEKPVKAVVSGDKSYHIIAGGFGVEANADRLAKKYQADGKNATVLGKFNDLYLVSYEAYATREEANSAMQSSGIKGWIFKYPK